MLRQYPALAVLTVALLLCTPTQANDTWGTILTTLLTPDGRWLIYLESRAEKMSVVVRSTHDAVESRYSSTGSLKISPSGRWIGFTTAGEAKPGVALIEIASGHRREMPDATDFDFIGTADEQVVLKRSASVTLQPLDGGRPPIDFPAVSAFVPDPKARRVALVDAAGLRIVDLTTRQSQTLEPSSVKGSYRHLVWSKQGGALAGLRQNRDLVVFRSSNTAEWARTEFEAPSDFDFSSRDELMWRDDEEGLYVRMQRKAPAETGPKAPNVALWHWKDEELPAWKRSHPPEQRLAWAFLRVRDRHLIMLSDGLTSEVQPSRRGRYALGYDIRAYGAWNRVSSVQKRDYYVIDLGNGERRAVVTGLETVTEPELSIQPRISPAGTHVLYQDNRGDYIVYDLRDSTRRNLTSGLPAKFYFEENSPLKPAPRRNARGNSLGSQPLVGWSSDGTSVLISDYHDVWLLSLNEEHRRNLTGPRRDADLVYRALFPTGGGALAVDFDTSTDPFKEDRVISLQEPMYFDVVDLRTARFGLARLQPGASATEILYLRREMYSYYKADRAELYVNLVSTSTHPPDLYLLGKNWQPLKRLTDINPQERRSPHGVRMEFLTYTTAHGDTLTAKLLISSRTKVARKHPTLVRIYEELYGTPYYYYPTPDDPDYRRWLDKGYALLYPAIRPRVGDPGTAAVDAVTSAVDAAVRTGLVDRDRLGLTGYSFGGYETAYVVTQTNLFKAALVKAGATNLWSFYGGVYGVGIPAAQNVESGFGYMGGPWWEHWEAYLRNSPLFHAPRIRTPLLLVHGDRDVAAPFAQAVELFSSLRRLGDRPVVLLQYGGEGHTFSLPQLEDIQTRTEQFFDHFLLGAPAPGWWNEGISYVEGDTPAASH